MAAEKLIDIASEIICGMLLDLVTVNKLLDTIRSTFDSIANNVENNAKEIELNTSCQIDYLLELPNMNMHELRIIISNC
ncbi:unnamed protein product [Brugia pahangi]|uniref:Ovule protein n=1 Tax=Brugia pahangi TaxID=6280 RepID=A0A0N4TYV8_BRUPA|nr:unnamed protein product [Brugia pahangi]